ncbi:MAG: TIR domain-containing protein [Clostridiales bacterium]|nr:TIR domain-containing protein [Clostridiales bacterium]
MGNRKIKKTAMLLCIFFGWFGAHRYYTEKWLTAILYTATLGLMGFGWLIDIALIAADQFMDGSGQPLLKASDLAGGAYGVYAIPPQKVQPVPVPDAPTVKLTPAPVRTVQPAPTHTVQPVPTHKMVTRFYTCPLCGKEQTQYIDENKTFAFCTGCGQKIDLMPKTVPGESKARPQSFTVTAYNGTEPFIFVSYAHRNSDKVVPIIAKIQADGYRVWFDEGIDPGTEWDTNIANHVRGCSLMLAFMSKEYLASENCKDELNFARDLSKNRILIYLEDVELPDGMAMRLNRLQAIHQYKYEDQKDFYEKLYNSPDLQSLR